MRTLLRSAVLGFTLCGAMTALADEPAPTKNPDPFERINRPIFRFNEQADRFVLKPVAQGYRAVTPRRVDEGISNFFNNLREPLTIMNQVLQGQFKAAASDTGRFLVNTTVGLAGFIDVAARIPLARHDEDFGQTLGVWGVKTGPYIMMPLFGPTTVRDGFGRGVDTVANPRRDVLDWEWDLGLYALDVIDSRADLIPLEGIIQGDRYLFMRDLYLQRRQFEVSNGAVQDDFLDAMDAEADSDSAAEATNPDASPEPAAPAAPLAPLEGVE